MRRIRGRLARHATIPYRLDASAEPGVQPREIDFHVNAPHPQILDYPFAAPPAPGATIEIAPGVSWLRMPLPFALDHINLWLLREPNGTTLVDCGYGDATTRELWMRHFETTLTDQPITRIIATHYHPDHLGNAAWIALRFGCPIVMTQTEFLAAHAIVDQRAGFALTDTCALFRLHGMAGEHLARLAERGNVYRRGVPEVPSRFDRMIAGDRVAAGGATWQVIPGYRHSPEHAALFAGESSLLISGDMLLPKITTNVSACGQPSPTATHWRASSVRSMRSEALPPGHRWCCRRTACRFAEFRCASRNCARITLRGSKSWRLRSRGRRAAIGGGYRPGPVSAPARSAAAILRDGRSNRAPQSPLAERSRDARRRRAARFGSPRRIGPRANEIEHTPESHNVHTAPTGTKSTAAQHDPAALAESLASAAEKSAKLMGEYAGPQRERPAVDVRRRARHREGLHGSGGEAAREPVPDGRSADEPVVGLHEPVADVDAARWPGAPTEPIVEPAQGRQALQARGLAGTLPVRLHQAVVPDHRRAGCTIRSAASRAWTSHTKKKVDFFTRQYIDALAPSNFALTNPEVFRETIATGGQNLVRRI